MYSECKAIRRGIIPLFSLFAWAGNAPRACAEGAARDLPDSCASEVPLSVSITVDAPPGTFVMNLEDSPPSGWTDVGNISNGGLYDAVHHKIKWGPFFSNLSRTVTYEVTPPGPPNGELCFVGTVFFDGLDQPVEGDECCVGSIKGDFDGDIDVDLSDYAMLVECMGGPETPPNPTAPVSVQDCFDVFDFDEDDDVDMFDVGEFQMAFTGP